MQYLSLRLLLRRPHRHIQDIIQCTGRVQNTQKQRWKRTTTCTQVVCGKWRCIFTHKRPRTHMNKQWIIRAPLVVTPLALSLSATNNEPLENSTFSWTADHVFVCSSYSNYNTFLLWMGRLLNCTSSIVSAKLHPLPSCVFDALTKWLHWSEEILRKGKQLGCLF